MTIIFPMAGLSSRFKKAGYKVPKYMLEIKGESVFYKVLSGFSAYFKTCDFLFIYREIENTSEFLQKECAKLNIKNAKFKKLENETLGQAHSVFLGIEELSDEEQILIFNIDTFRLNYLFPKELNLNEIDGYLEVFEDEGEQWSFVLPKESLNKNTGLVAKTAEKERISPLCSSGLYYFKRVKDFKDVFKLMFERKDFSKNELYIAPMYNYLIDKNKQIYYQKINKNQVIFCGIPSEYEALLK